MKLSAFHNCYNNQWRNLIVPEAFSHPAKFSPGLIQKIYSHMLDRGYIRPGDLIGDPFGGIGGGGIFAAFAKLRWVGVELERKFVDLSAENFDLHRATWESYGYPVPVILQGDSRRFAGIVGGCSAICTSPPYAGNEKSDYRVKDQNGDDRDQRRGYKQGTGCFRGSETYGDSPGQIGTLKAGDLSGIVTSPPYISGGHHPDQTGAWGGLAARKGFADKETAGYGVTDGQIGKLKAGTLSGVVTSPPYGDAVSSKAHGIDWSKAGPETGNRKRGAGCKHGETFDAQLNYSQDPANIGNLKMDGIVTSPPWEDREGSLGAHKFKDLQTAAKKMSQCRGHASTPTARMDQLMKASGETYGDSPGQVGKETADTYWKSMDTVYRQCWLPLKPGGYMAVVVKSYVKNKRRVNLPMQTLKLLIHIGFEPVERIKAMLVKSDIQRGVFGDVEIKKERKSFFRRLAEKNGSPRIDWEEVLIVRKT